MARLWDPDTGQYYNFEHSELSDLLRSGEYEDATMELLRRKREEQQRYRQAMTHSTPANTPWDDKPDPVEPEESFPSRIGGHIVGGAKKAYDALNFPFLREAGRSAGYGVDLPGPAGHLTQGLRALGRVKGHVQESLPNMREAYNLEVEPRTIDEYRDYEPTGTMQKIGQALLAGGITAARPETHEAVEEDLPEHTADVASMITPVDVAALALTPWSGGASASPWALRVNKLARAVDAVDAAMGVGDVMEGHPIAGGIRILGGGAGASRLGKMDDLRKVPGLDDLDELGELRRLADEEGLSESQIARLEQLEQATELDDSVQAVNRTQTPDSHPLVVAYRQAREDGSWNELADDMEAWETSLTPEEASFIVSAEPGLREYRFIDDLASQYDAGPALPAPASRDVYEAPEVTERGGPIVRMAEHEEKALDSYQQLLKQEIDKAQAEGRAADMTNLIAEEQAYNRAQERVRDISELSIRKMTDPNFTPDDQMRLEQLMAEAQVDNAARQAETPPEIIQRLRDPEGARAPQEPPMTPEEAAELAFEQKVQDANLAPRDAQRLAEAVEAGEDPEVALAGILKEYEAQRLASEAKAVADAQRAEAEAPLAWKDWVAKNYPDGFGNKKRMSVVAEYGRYKKAITTATSGAPPKPPKPPRKGKRPKKGKPEEPKLDAVNLSAFRRAVGRSLENIKRSMPQVGHRMEQFLMLWEAPKARFIAERKALSRQLEHHARENGLNPRDREKLLVKALDEGIEAVPELTPIERQIYEKFVEHLKYVADRAEVNKVLVGRRQKYFPHFFRESGWTPPEKLGGTSRRYQDVVRKASHLEKSREGRTGWIDELAVLDNYYDESFRRISESVVLGKQHEKLRKVIDLYGGLDPQTASHVELAIKHIAQTAEVNASAKTFARIRYIQGLTDLGLAGLYQPTQLSHTTALAGVHNTAKALKEVLQEAYYRRVKNLEPQGENILHLAEKEGALLPDTMLDTMSNTRKDLLGALPSNFMWGVPTMDRYMRVISFRAGQHLGVAAKNGDADAIKTLEMMGFDTTKKFTPERVGKFISDRTQFKTGPATKPVWTQTSEWGKFFWQYKQFAYHHGIFVKDLFQQSFKTKNFKPLVRFLVAGGLAGEILGNARSLIRGKDPLFGEGANYDTDDQAELALHALFDRSQRIPIEHPFWRLVQNYTMIGGLGIAQETIGDQLLYPSMGGTAGQALGAAPANAAELVDKTFTQGPTGAARWGAEQLPIWGYDISKMMRPLPSHRRRGMPTMPRAGRFPGSR